MARCIKCNKVFSINEILDTGGDPQTCPACNRLKKTMPKKTIKDLAEEYRNNCGMAGGDKRLIAFVNNILTLISECMGKKEERKHSISCMCNDCIVEAVESNLVRKINSAIKQRSGIE
jgi:hypothetical protein